MLDIQVDTKAFKKWTKRYPSQVGFATSKAINRTALQGQKAVRANLRKKFQIRRPGFADRSVKMVKFAKKRDLEAIIQIISQGATPDIFSKFERGGIKRARESSRIAIPLPEFWTKKSRVIPRSKRPDNLKNAFTITSRSGQDLILQRKGRGRRGKNIIAYALEKQVRIEPRLAFHKTMAGIFNRRWQSNFDVEFAAAVRSMT